MISFDNGETFMECWKCNGRGWYWCTETHGLDGIEIHDDGRKECRRCGGTGKVKLIKL